MRPFSSNAFPLLVGGGGNNHVSKSCCLFCYKICEVEEVDVRPQFLEAFEKHLRNDGGLRRISAGGDEAWSDVERVTGFCEDCGKVLATFCELFHEMKTLELRVNWQLWKLRRVMTCADKVSSRVKGLEEMVQKKDEVDNVKEMRKELVKKCSLKMRRSLPWISLTRCDDGGKIDARRASCRSPPKPPRGLDWPLLKRHSNCQQNDLSETLEVETAIASMPPTPPPPVITEVQSLSLDPPLSKVRKVQESPPAPLPNQEATPPPPEEVISAPPSEAPPSMPTQENLVPPQVDHEVVTISSDEDEPDEQVSIEEEDEVMITLSRHRVNTTKPSADPLATGIPRDVPSSEGFVTSTQYEPDDDGSSASRITSDDEEQLTTQKTVYEALAMLSTYRLLPGDQTLASFVAEEDLWERRIKAPRFYLNDFDLRGRFPCDFCPVIDKYAPNLALHEFHHHAISTSTISSASTFKCARCRFISSTKHSYLRHHLVVHLHLRWGTFCPICEKVLPHRQNQERSQLLLHHWLTHHDTSSRRRPEDIHRCSECSCLFRTVKQLNRHKYFNHHLPLRRCRRCDLEFNSVDIFRSHLTQCHPTSSDDSANRYPCHMCSTVLKTSSDFACHLTTSHTGEPGLTCPLGCGAKFFDKPDVTYHIFRYHRQALLSQHKVDKMMTDANFTVAIEVALQDLIVGLSQCRLCGGRYTYAAQCEQHIMLRHWSELTKNLVNHQVGLPLISVSGTSQGERSEEVSRGIVRVDAASLLEREEGPSCSLAVLRGPSRGTVWRGLNKN